MTLTPTASSRGERSPNPGESRSSVPWKKHKRCVWCPRKSGASFPAQTVDISEVPFSLPQTLIYTIDTP
jgi:hypothetical protein